MLGVSGLLGSSGDGAAAHEHGGSGGEMDGTAGPSRGGIFSEEEKGRVEEGDRSSAGNRWPRQETLALLKIRSDMDVAFRDSTVKGPLWEEVSRKLAELGYHRSAKKCKEKFENVYKYHKRTKEGRASKADGKNYPFFDQLEALENHPLHPSSKPQIPATAMPGTNPPPPPPPPPVVSQVVQETTTTKPFSQVLGVDSTVPSATNPITVTQNTVTPSSTINSTNLLPPPPPPPTTTTITNPKRTYPSNAIRYSNPNVMLNSTSSSTSSDEEPRRRRLKRKRKWEDLLERVMKEVIQKQEELQRKFLEALEKRERDRMEREEAWRVQEMARMNREHDLLVQERSMAAAKDASLIAFLQKISQQQQNPNSSQMQAQVQPLPLPLPPPSSPPRQQPQPPPPPSPPTLDNRKTGETFVPNSSSRWPKVEVEALIRLRAELDLKYQENGPKGPLWEEMSMAMRKIGYDRSAKRCKEKWENINKYFKKVKESNKKRPEDSKTCPYFHQLDALYKEKNKNDTSLINHGLAMKPENDPMVPIMVQPEQQWPLPAPVMEDQARENIDQINDDGDMDDDDDDDEEEDGGGGYEIVTNKASSVATVERDKRERNENVDV